MDTTNNPNEKSMSLPKLLILLILFSLPSFLINSYRFSYFNNPDIDNQLLFFINIDFSRFVLASISILVLGVAILFIFIKAYKAKTLIPAFIFLFIPFFSLFGDVYEGMNILFHTKNIFQPDISTFGWEGSHDYLLSKGNGMRWALVIRIVLFGLFLFLFFRLFKKK
jgi:hypothetical protein